MLKKSILAKYKKADSSDTKVDRANQSSQLRRLPQSLDWHIGQALASLDNTPASGAASTSQQHTAPSIYKKTDEKV